MSEEAWFCSFLKFENVGPKLSAPKDRHNIYIFKIRAVHVILMEICQEHSIFMERNTSLYEKQVLEEEKTGCVRHG